MSKLKTYFNWSSGKDSSLALYYLQKNSNLQIDKLVTSINSNYNRVSMHGLRRELLVAQAKSINIPLETIELPKQPTMEEYAKLMEFSVKKLISKGYTHCAFEDIFLEDLRKY